MWMNDEMNDALMVMVTVAVKRYGSGPQLLLF